MEKNIATILQVIISATLIWVGSSLVVVRESVIRLETRYEATLKEVNENRADIILLRTQVLIIANARSREVK